jgi:hypothetical protein
MSRSKRASKRPPTATSPARRPPVTPVEALPAWLPPLVYAFATVILFREFFFGGGLLLGSDTYALSYFARDFYTDFVRESHRFPLWEPYLFGGLPFVEGMHGDIFYPLSLALFFLDARAMWGWKMVLHVFLAGVFTYLWLRGLGLRRGPAFFGGLVFMMGADLVSLVLPGGDGKLFVSALAPLMFWLTERAVSRRGIADFAFFSLGLALVMFTSHMQLAYFTVWGVSLYFLFRLWQVWRAEKEFASAVGLLAAFALAGVLGVAAAAVQFLPPLGYLRAWSHRADKTVQAEAESGYAYSTTWSLHPEEAVSLVVPEFVGDSAPTEARSTYWGRNSFKINHEYAGLVPLLLIPVLLIRRREAASLFFMALAALTVLYALGATTPLFRLFYLLPAVNLFRAPSLIIFLYGLSVATLGALGLQRLLDWSRTGGEEVHSTRKVLWIVAGVFGLLALLTSAGAITSIWESLFGVIPQRRAALDANLPNIRLGFWISFVLAAAVAGLWEGMWRGRIGWRTAVLAFALLAAVDLYRIDRPFIRSTVLMGQRAHDPALFQPDETIRFLQEAQRNGEVFRVFNYEAYDHNVLAVHRIEQITGHHGNEIGRYRTLVGGDAAENMTADLRLMDLLNATYLIAPQRLQAAGLEEVFVGSRSAVYRKAGVLPRAYLVGRAEVVPDDAAVERLLSVEFDPHTTALLSEPLAAELEPDPVGSVRWTDRQVNGYTLRVETDRPALLMILDNYFPAWQAEVDGRAASVVRANYTFRAVPIPAGEHDVRFYYESATLRASAAFSIIVLSMLLATALAGTWWRVRRTGSLA